MKKLRKDVHKDLSKEKEYNQDFNNEYKEKLLVTKPKQTKSSSNKYKFPHPIKEENEKKDLVYKFIKSKTPSYDDSYNTLTTNNTEIPSQSDDMNKLQGNNIIISDDV